MNMRFFQVDYNIRNHVRKILIFYDVYVYHIGIINGKNYYVVLILIYAYLCVYSISIYTSQHLLPM